MEGSGKFLVTAVGVHSQAGIIFTLLGATDGTGAVGFAEMEGETPGMMAHSTITTTTASAVPAEKATVETPLLNQNSQQQKQRVPDGIGHQSAGTGNPSGNSRI
ncbi:hypothetical protein ACTXT7_002228 [Hymenolepis weldensis]